MYCSNDETPLIVVNENIKRKILSHQGGLMTVEVHFSGQTDNPYLHSHPHEQIVYVLEGIFEFQKNGEKFRMIPGDTAYFEPNVEHGSVLADGRTEGKLLDIFTPQREDFLK